MIRAILATVLLAGCPKAAERPIYERDMDTSFNGTLTEPRATSTKTEWPSDAVPPLHGWWAIGNSLLKAPEPTVLLQSGWDLPEGTELKAHSANEAIPVIVGTATSGTYGCDDTPVERLVPLRGAPEQELIWLTSPTATGVSGLEVLTVEEDSKRLFQAGDATLGLTQVGENVISMWFVDESREITRIVGTEILPPELLEQAPITLTQSVFVPRVIAAWQMGDAVVFGLRSDTLESHGWQVVVIHNDAATIHDLGNLYFCAF